MDDLIIPPITDIKDAENASEEAVKIIELPPHRESFAQHYAKSGNGVESYGLANGLDIESPLVYARAATMAGRWLKNVEIVARINQLLNLNDFNNESMDTTLNFIAHQKSNLKVALAAVVEYNKLKGRTNNKTNIFNGNQFNLSAALKQANQL